MLKFNVTSTFISLWLQRTYKKTNDDASYVALKSNSRFQFFCWFHHSLRKNFVGTSKRRYIVRLISTLQHCWQKQTRKFLSVYYTLLAKIKQQFCSQKFRAKKQHICVHIALLFFLEGCTRECVAHILMREFRWSCCLLCGTEVLACEPTLGM